MLSKSLIVVPLVKNTDVAYWYSLIKKLGQPVLLQSLATNSQYQQQYDIISAAPELMLRVIGNNTIVQPYSDTCQFPKSIINISKNKDIFYLLNKFMPSSLSQRDIALSIPFQGGFIGYWGYELNETLYPKHIKPREESDPKMVAGLYLWAIIIDHHKNQVLFVAHHDLCIKKQRAILACITNKSSLYDKKRVNTKAFHLTSAFQSDTKKSNYEKAFHEIQRYLLAGDCYQVNLAQRFSAKFEGDFWQAHQRMCQTSPTPFTSYLDFGDIKVSSHSPERFLLANQKKVETSPIKGTCLRGKTKEEDAHFAAQLKDCEKNQSENLMIVDLLRNDLGKLCIPGSIKVPHLFKLESFPNVHHLVSYITGQLASNEQQIDLLKLAFPGGSITGAPKIRAMQIIRELEPFPRSVYCGSIGYISCHGRMDTSIAIRTVVARKNQLFCWGGGAIIADSEVESEYQESIAKVKNIMMSLEV